MKKVNSIISLICLTLLATAAGCKKFLDVKSDAKLVVPKTLSDIQGLLDDGNLMNIGKSPSFGEASSDDFFLPLETYRALITRGQEAYTWKATPYRYPNDWSAAYSAVYNTNLSLELLEKIDRTNANAIGWDNAMGSARFFRAYYYLMLTSQFGLAYGINSAEQDLGIALRLNSDFNLPSLRTTVSECYKQVIMDANAAYESLPTYPLHVMRPSKGAAAALLSRCYLYMHDYEKALEYANKALAINNKLMDFNADADLLALSNAVPIKKFNKETIWYAELSSNFGVNTVSRARIDTALYSSYSANDLRKTAFFKSAAPYQQFKGNYTGNATVYFSGLATDELYLTSAECKAWLNNLTGAMDDLNYLLKSRWKNSAVYTPISASTKADALKKIRYERRKELLMRGLRFADIKRYNQEGEKITLKRIIEKEEFTLLPESRYYALPIPTDVIQLSGMVQN
jgi:tetratricopeptide (TPR) repeat protein